MQFLMLVVPKTTERGSLNFYVGGHSDVNDNVTDEKYDDDYDDDDVQEKSKYQSP